VIDLARRGDPFLERAELVREGGLVTDRRRNAAEQGRHLGARLDEAEYVVYEEEHVLVFLVAEIFGHGKT